MAARALQISDRFARLADRLILERGAAVILTGGPDDAAGTERIRSMMQQEAVDWAGKTTLRELAALASFAELFTQRTRDPCISLPAAGARVVALFGPTAPWRTGPYGKGNVTVRAGLDCSPCFRRTCENAVRCMEAVTVEDVLSRIPDF